MRKSLVLLSSSLFAFSAFASSFGQYADQSSFTATQREEIQKIIHEYVVTHPEILVEASKALENQQMEKVIQKGIEGARQNAEAIFREKTSPVIGNPNGNVTIVEFFDYRCPHCRDMYQHIEKLIKNNANLRVVFKEFPIFGQASELLSKAALAAHHQNKYWEFHREIMQVETSDKNNALDKNKLVAIAEKLKLEMSAFKKELEIPLADNKELQANYSLAKKMELMFTPVFLIAKTNTAPNSNDIMRFIPGETKLETLQKAIDEVK